MPNPPSPADSPLELSKRLATARSEWTLAVSILEGGKPPSPKYSEESKLIKLARQVSGDLEKARGCVTSFWKSAEAAGWRVGPGCSADMKAEVYAALMDLKLWVWDDADVEDPPA